MQPGRLRPGNADDPDIRVLDTAQLQCSRGVSAPETLTDAAISHETRRASMQPGRLRPGNVATEERLTLVLQASMQPGRLRPGNVIVARITESFSLLQCSRGVSAPETTRCPTRRGASSALQCSRGVSAPETTWTKAGRTIAGNGFNAAGASPPRKLLPTVGSEDVTIVLQCSRGVSAPETLVCGLPTCDSNMLQCSRGVSAPETQAATADAASKLQASMQPGRLRPGNTYSGNLAFTPFLLLQCSRGVSAPETRPTRFVVVSSMQCFNAAGASPPRKPVRVARRAEDERASMQPGRLRPGNTTSSYSVALSDWLQCSRGVSAPETRSSRVFSSSFTVSLQCSRGVSAPETLRVNPGAGIAVLLQCSRGVSAPETATRENGGRLPRPCFNAAGASPPRKRR